MEIELVIKKIKKELESIYPSLSKEMPSGSDPQSIEMVKAAASYASANATTMAIYLKELTAFEKQREAEITLKAIEEKTLCTPKEEHLRALNKRELAEIYAYKELCQNVLDICKQRVVLAQSFLKTQNVENISSRGIQL